MQKLEGLKYATALYFNIGYYNIRLLNVSQEIMKIVTEFGKFRLKCLPMGMCASGDIFKSTVDDLLDDIKDIKTYIDYILVLIKERFS